jgi:hypothetical protein
MSGPILSYASASDTFGTAMRVTARDHLHSRPGHLKLSSQGTRNTRSRRTSGGPKCIKLREMALCGVVIVFPIVANGQQTVSVTVRDDFGRTISLDTNQCTNSTCSPSPPSSIASGATSPQFGAVSGSGQYNPLLTTRWNAYIGAQQYGCQFQAQSNMVGSSCTSPTVSANAHYGVWPQPYCKVLSYHEDTSPPCNLTATFSMSSTP